MNERDAVSDKREGFSDGRDEVSYRRDDDSDQRDGILDGPMNQGSDVRLSVPPP